MPPYLKSSLLEEIPYLMHGFFTRAGGKSSGFYATLNAGFEKGDDPESVYENRRRICQIFGLTPEDLGLVRQEHTDVVYEITKPFPREAIPVGDALITMTPNLLIGVQTADCVPILLADKTFPLVAAVHSGWRGAVGGVIEKTVKAMLDKGSKAENIVAALGPCIWQESYEVSQEFYDKLKGNEQFFMPGKKPNHYQFDLPGYVISRLEKAGITKISPSIANTFANEENFFSYRRKTLTNADSFGNQISVICIQQTS
ncbi:MAG: peptidoglycan editing factor PgeF [Alphaproteobacteria bacterium]|nr:peptidoglycan editing factor PgeF [Alphaproteobacteria bacterium]